MKTLATVSANDTTRGNEFFSWQLNQARIDVLACLFLRLESIANTVAPGCLAAKSAAAMLTDLREQTLKAGAEDPCPDRPMSPRLEDIRATGEAIGGAV